jgi:hypothetical protein
MVQPTSAMRYQQSITGVIMERPFQWGWGVQLSVNMPGFLSTPLGWDLKELFQ